MGKLLKNEKGFGVVEVAILLVVLIVMSIGGLYIHKKQKTTKLPTCGSTACIEQKFASCNPATYSFTAQTPGIMQSAAVRILHKAKSGCTMYVNYTNLTDASFTCDFDNKLSLSDSVTRAEHSFEYRTGVTTNYNCNGSLVDQQNQYKQLQQNAH